MTNVAVRGGNRGLPLRSWGLDALIAVVVTAVNVLLLLGFPVLLRTTRLVVIGVCLAAVFMGLLVRRVLPWAGLAVVLASAVVLAAADVPLVVLSVSPVVSVYAAAAWLPVRQAVAAFGVTLAGMAVVEVVSGFVHDPSSVAGNVAVLGASWGVGALAAERQRHVVALEARTAELEAARHELARQAVIAERLRIARELHDVVAHAVSVITVRSGIAAHVAGTRPEEATSALAAIEQVGRQALDDLRRLLGVLRAEETLEITSPLPGIADLLDLVRTVGEGTLSVDLEIDGDAASLDPSLQLTVYRLVQEALTNAIRHGRASRAVVQVTRTDDDLHVRVRDSGQGTDGVPHDGHGLRGMRERVAMYGGRLDIGNASGGGFCVDARLPLDRHGDE